MGRRQWFHYITERFAPVLVKRLPSNFVHREMIFLESPSLNEEEVVVGEALNRNEAVPVISRDGLQQHIHIIKNLKSGEEGFIDS